MGLILRDTDPNPGQRGRIGRVPDYTSRPVKLRLFVLVAGLMLVLYVAERARDPRSWNWFFALDRPTPVERIDNRRPVKVARTAGESTDTVVIAATDPPAHETGGGESSPQSQKSSALTRAWSDGLRQLWSELSSDQRTLWFHVLENVQDRKIWPAAEREAVQNLIAALDQKWTDHHVAAFQTVAGLDGEEQSLWAEVLRRTNERWTAEVKSSLETFAAGKTVLPDQEQGLARLLDDLRDLNLGRVQDDTPFLHPNDNQIWHHLFWQLGRSETSALLARSKGEIAYAQLFRQPGQHRGQIVTMHGAARRAYRVRASRNHLGIQEYFVFWLQPFESADTPLVVYALHPPKGFPPIKDRDRDGMTVLNEDLVCQGFLFKRGAYAGEGGTYNAPLLLAGTPDWKPASLGLRVTESQGNRVAWRAGTIALALSVLIAAGVYWTTFRRVRPAPIKEEMAVVASLRRLQDADVLPSPEEALRQFEKEARADDGDRPPT